MNIALVLRRFDRDGGVERYAVNLAGGLISRGHEVHVYACSFGGDALPGTHHLLPGVGRGIVGLLRFQQHLRRIHGHDVVQCFERAVGADVFRCGGGIHAEWVARRGTGWWRRTVGALSVRDRVECWLDARTFRNTPRIICNSSMVQRQLVARYGIPAERIDVVRNGVDGGQFRPDATRRAEARRSWAAEARVVLFLGHGFHRKGLHTAANAFQRIAREGDRFVVMGRDRHAARYLRPVRTLLGEKLVHHGPEAYPERWLPGADVTVLPTLYDAAANTTLESLSCGVPAVTSTADGNQDVVPEGLVAEPGDVSGFARAIETALAGGDTLRSDCRDRAQCWPVSRNAEHMESIYEALVHG